ncbi:hypothetical protein ES708_27111 [subsurface metagenome]
MSPVKQAYPTADNYPCISSQLFSQVGVIKPHYSDIARFIADNSLSTPPTTQPRLLSLPHISNNSLLLPLSKL